MDIRVVEEEGYRGIEITIVSAPGNPRVPRIVENLRAAYGRLVGYPADGSVSKHVIPLDDITLIEMGDRRAFMRTVSGESFESPMRLFELEAMLESTEFIRVSRQVLVNFDKVLVIRPELNGRLVLELTGGEHVLVTRNYAADIRHKIGILP